MSTLDEYLRLLADAQRRRLLRALLDDDSGSVPVEQDDKHAYARLHHFHLPKLERAGLVDWNRRGGTVARGPAFDEIVPLLEALDDVTGEGEGGGAGDADENDGGGNGTSGAG